MWDHSNLKVSYFFLNISHCDSLNFLCLITKAPCTGSAEHLAGSTRLRVEHFNDERFAHMIHFSFQLFYTCLLISPPKRIAPSRQLTHYTGTHSSVSLCVYAWIIFYSALTSLAWLGFKCLNCHKYLTFVLFQVHLTYSNTFLILGPNTCYLLHFPVNPPRSPFRWL